MTVTFYHLEARSPFHFGERGIGVESTRAWPHADTLFAALCNELCHVSGKGRLEQLLTLFKEHRPPFVLSSAFPFVTTKTGDVVRFYPRPYLPLPQCDLETDPKAAKKFKKITLVSEIIFTQWLTGDEQISEAFQQENYFQGHIAMTPAEREQLTREVGQYKATSLWKIENMPRVTIDRMNNQSQIFHAGRLFFAPKGGLWLAIRWLDEAWRREIEIIWEILGDTGIGGERSAGHGQFTFSTAVTLPLWTTLATNGQDTVTLAPYYPDPSEVAHWQTATNSYKLIERRGWLASPHSGSLRHKTVSMLAEGSLLPPFSPSRIIWGKMADVTPQAFDQHDVYRYGFAFPVFAKDVKVASHD